MSLMFTSGLSIKTRADGAVRITGPEAELSLTMDEFLQMAQYVLTNTDFAADDPRGSFIKKLRYGHFQAGFNEGCSRFVLGRGDEYERALRGKRANASSASPPRDRIAL